MVKVMLVCNMGMSTSMLVTKMQESADRRGIDARIWAVPEAKAAVEGADADVVLLGPQIRYLEDRIAAQVTPVPVSVVDVMQYGRMDGDAVLDSALDHIA